MRYGEDGGNCTAAPEVHVSPPVGVLVRLEAPVAGRRCGDGRKEVTALRPGVRGQLRRTDQLHVCQAKTNLLFV